MKSSFRGDLPRRMRGRLPPGSGPPQPLSSRIGSIKRIGAMVSMPPSAATAEQRAELSLGIFMPNCSYSCSISTYKPDPDDWTFESNTAIAQAAEQAGFRSEEHTSEL